GRTGVGEPAGELKGLATDRFARAGNAQLLGCYVADVDRVAGFACRPLVVSHRQRDDVTAVVVRDEAEAGPVARRIGTAIFRHAPGEEQRVPARVARRAGQFDGRPFQAGRRTADRQILWGEVQYGDFCGRGDLSVAIGQRDADGEGGIPGPVVPVLV